MARYSIVDAKNNFSALIEAAEAGEDVIITRHGKPVVQFVPPAQVEQQRPAMAVVLEELRQLRAKTPATGISGAALIRQMRDEGY